MPMSSSGSSAYQKISRGRLGSGPDFRDLNSDALRYFNSIAQQITYPGGSVVFKEGDPVEGIYVLRIGQVKLFATSPVGRITILKIARPGDVLGLSAMLNDLPYEVTAMTLSPCHFIYLRKHPFLKLLVTHAAAGYTTAVILAKEHRELVLGMRRMALASSAAARIAYILVGLAGSEHRTKRPLCFPMILTHAELASLAGASRETVTRFLNQIERDGIISRNDATMTILKRAELERLAH